MKADENGRVNDEVGSVFKLWRLLFGEEPGYLCVSSGMRSGSPKLRDFGDRFFRHPEQVEEAAEWTAERSDAGYEVYFCTHLLTEPQRRATNAAPVHALWADGDDGTLPESLPAPSVTVKSSPGRWQWYWLLTESVEPKVAEKLNKRIAEATGADASGYDLTQLLRPPGSVNHKYPDTPEVRVVEQTGELHDPDELDRLLPALPEKPEKEPYTGPEDAGFDLEDFLERHPDAGDSVMSEREDDTARVKYAIVCPWVEEHTGGDDSGTFLGQYPSGGLFFKCRHDHCEKRGWSDYRAFYEPHDREVQFIKTGETPAEDFDSPDDPCVTDTTAGMSRPEAPSGRDGTPIGDTYDTVTPTYRPARSLHLGRETFPSGVLSPVLRTYLGEAAHAKETPVEFVALPMLAALGTAIGASRYFRPERTWAERPALYTAVVALPASGKSPAEDAAMLPVYRQSKMLNREYKDAQAEYKREYQEWERKAAEARRSKSRIPQEPEKPVKKRIRVGDATVEALNVRMVENPRGLVLARDELSGFFTSLNQYKGGAGADRQFWLSQHSGRVAPVDRKSSDETYDVEYPCVSVVGSIQPEKLHVLDLEAGDGMVERFLFAWPEATVQPDAERDISEEAERRYVEVWDALYALDMGEDEYGNFAPKYVPLAPEAEPAWRAYKRGLKDAANEPGVSSFMRGVFGKMKAHLPRLALILALVRTVESGETVEEIREEDLANAWELVEYFATQSRRVYSEFKKENKNDLLAHALASLLESNDGEWTGSATELFRALKELGYARVLPAKPDALTHAVLKAVRISPTLSARKNERTREGRSLTVKRINAGDGDVGREGQ